MTEDLDDFSVATPWFRPRWFLGGFLVMLVVLALAGRWAGRLNYHRDFTRFFPDISPESNYYPTVAEMCSIVRGKCRPDQVLVIVGGNSIHFGVGQPPGQVWTDRLQELLGDGYCVINFAFRGSSIVDGGAVIGEVLRKEFPRQIYVANTAPVLPTDPLGIEVFRYLFWDAYFKGQLVSYAPRDERVGMYFTSARSRLDEMSIRLNAWSDGIFRYRDLWNWFGWEKFFTVVTPKTRQPSDMFQPRRLARDTEPDSRDTPFEQRFRPEIHAAEMSITRGFSILPYEKTPEGNWHWIGDYRSSFVWNAVRMMPDAQKHRTLIVLSQNSPYYLAMLSPDERARNDLAYADSILQWREVGYDAMTYPAGMINEDFVDRTHLTVTGGNKLAVAVASEVKTLAQTLNYLSASHL